MISNFADQQEQQRRDREDAAQAARSKARMENQPRSNGPSDKSVDRLVRSSRVMYGDQPTEATIREWAAGQPQRAVSDRISAIEAMPGFQAKRAAASAQKGTQPRAASKLAELGALHVGSKSRYAIHHDGQLRFYRVDNVTEGRWAGYTFMKEGVGGGHGDLVWHSMGRDRREAAAAAVLESGANEALKRFGQEVGSCGHCGRTLTDETSRAFGIGPVCRGKLGW